MTFISISEASADLRAIVAAVASGAETSVTVTLDGVPAAKLVPLTPRGQVIRLGVGEGRFTVPDDLERDKEAVAQMFGEAGECD